jgi:hypothetical protein
MYNKTDQDSTLLSTFQHISIPLCATLFPRIIETGVGRWIAFSKNLQFQYFKILESKDFLFRFFFNMYVFLTSFLGL